MTDGPASTKTLGDAWLTALMWCALMAAALILRPLLPIDETRYVTVAWEMWMSGEYLVPTLNGDLYSHKPPFLFWFMNLGWSVAGVTEIWARLVSPLFGLGALVITARLARALWPGATTEALNARAAMAPLMLLGGVYWAVFSTMTMFDTAVTFGALVALWGTLMAWKGFATGQGFWLGVLVMGLGIGIGGLAKGPAVLVHTLPVALLAPLWGPRTLYGRGASGWAKWYAGVFAALVLGVALVLAWAVPAAIAGGQEYRDAIFIKQSADRMVKSFAHRRPFYWFAAVLPVLLLPWTLWPRLWRGVGFARAWRERRGLRGAWKDGGVRFLLIWAGAAFIVFSAISGKQPHYLLPVFPALALFAAYLLTRHDAGRVYSCGHGHRLPVLVLGAVALLVLAAGLGQAQIAPLLSKPLPEWAAAVEPLWMIPALILAFAAAKTRASGPRGEVRLIAVTVASFIVFLHMAAQPGFKIAYDLGPAARQVQAWQLEGRPVAYVGKYHGEFQFLGRLTQPLTTVNGFVEAKTWAQANPTGVIIATRRARDIPAEPTPIRIQPYRGKVLVMWDAAGF